MNHYRCTIQYKGTHYFGWQVQPGGNTIQGQLNKALEKICKSNEIKTIGSGRTDAKVHANGQVVKISIPLDIDPVALARAINSLTPEDICVLESSRVGDDFHPIFKAKAKEYHYLFTGDEYIHPIFRDLVTCYTFDLNFELMHEAVNEFIGTHDFANFMTTGTDVSSTVRTIFEASLDPHSFGLPGAQQYAGWLFKISGNGFLKQMVRLIVGSLWNIGRGKLTIDALRSSLGGPLDFKPGFVAPPQGLYLHRVSY